VAENLELHMKVGRHDQSAMASPEVRNAFERFVKLEEELLALAQKRVEQDRGMLTGSRSA
jgi:hypothetical protein